MSKTEQVKKQEKKSTSAETVTDVPVAEQSKGEKLKEAIDSILDEIDEVLESDAQAFVDGFKQKGGE